MGRGETWQEKGQEDGKLDQNGGKDRMWWNKEQVKLMMGIKAGDALTVSFDFFITIHHHHNIRRYNWALIMVVRLWCQLHHINLDISFRLCVKFFKVIWNVSKYLWACATNISVSYYQLTCFGLFNIFQCVFWDTQNVDIPIFFLILI